MAAAFVGFWLTASSSVIKARASRCATWVGAWFAWTSLSALFSPTAKLGEVLGHVVVSCSIFLLVYLSAAVTPALEAIAAAIVTSAVWIGLVCLQLAMSPEQCIAFPEDAPLGALGAADGRPCEAPETCYRDAPDPDALYRCEQAGWFGTTTVDEGRTRYVGVFHDPNETSLAVALAIPLAVALWRRRRTFATFALAAASASTATAAVVTTRSRGGLLVLGTLPIAYAWLSGRRKLALGSVLLVGTLATFAARTGERAAASTAERLEILQEGLAMLRAYPLTGVGAGQFTEHHALTAHNSFLLAASEGGLLGLFLWTAVASRAVGAFPPPLSTTDDHVPSDEANWRLAVRVSTCALITGSLFLSMNHHVLTWLYVGLASAVSARHERRTVAAGLPFTTFEIVRIGALAMLALLGIVVAARS